mgnify:CR=1 FL=1
MRIKNTSIFLGIVKNNCLTSPPHPRTVIPVHMKPHYFNEIYRLFSRIKSPADAELLLKDMLTPAELKKLAERWQLVKMLSKGTPHRKISKTLGISISLVTRGSHAYKKSRGGFGKYL